jgi:hypothetical protein
MLRRAAILVVALAVSAGATPALAINHGQVPGDNCSGNPNSVGQPNPPSGGNSPLEGGSPNVINDVADPVQAPASLFNAADTASGQADGAQGQANQQATSTGNCLDAGP